MKETTHKATPGPWHANGGSVFVDTRRQVCCGKGYAECCGNPDIEGDYFEVAQCGEADARLIAASPDLYEALLASTVALEECANILRERLPSLADNVIGHHVRVARAAIARATGEKPSGSKPAFTSACLAEDIRAAAARIQRLEEALRAIINRDEYPAVYGDMEKIARAALEEKA